MIHVSKPDLTNPLLLPSAVGPCGVLEYRLTFHYTLSTCRLTFHYTLSLEMRFYFLDTERREEGPPLGKGGTAGGADPPVIILINEVDLRIGSQK